MVLNIGYHMACSKVFKELYNYMRKHEYHISYPEEYHDRIILEFVKSDDLTIEPIPYHVMPDMNKVIQACKMSDVFEPILYLSPTAFDISSRYWHERMIYISMFEYHSKGKVSYKSVTGLVPKDDDNDVKIAWHNKYLGKNGYVTNPDGSVTKSMVSSLRHIIMDVECTEVVKIYESEMSEYERMIEEYPKHFRKGTVPEWDFDPLTLWYIFVNKKNGLPMGYHDFDKCMSIILKARRMTIELINSFTEACPEHVLG